MSTLKGEELLSNRSPTIQGHVSAPGISALENGGAWDMTLKTADRGALLSHLCSTFIRPPVCSTKNPVHPSHSFD